MVNLGSIMPGIGIIIFGLILISIGSQVENFLTLPFVIGGIIAFVAGIFAVYKGLSD